jgi:hypothetical protein
VPPRESSKPFAAGEVGLRVNALRREQHPAVADLTVADLAVLRALISLADWRTGEIPAGLDDIAIVAGPTRTTISTARKRFVDLGLLRECWRSSKQVKYALGDLLRARRLSAV